MNISLYKLYLGFLKYKLKPVRWNNGVVDFITTFEESYRLDSDLISFKAKHENSFFNKEQEKSFYSQIKLKNEK